MTNLYFPICATFVSGLLLITFIFKKKADILDTKLYMGLLATNFIDALIGSILIFIGYKFPDSPFISILNRIDFPQYILWLWFFFLYIYHVSTKEKKINTYFPQIFKITAVINVFIVLLLLLLPFNVINENNVMYAEGICVNFLYLCCVMYLVLTFFVILINIKNLFNKKYAPVFVLIILGFAVAYVRVVNPGLLLISAVICYINLIMYFTIENPDVKMIEQINIAKDHAEKANAAKTDFLSSMSHEIRTPLNAIVGFSEAIEEETDVEAMKNDAKDIVMAAHNLLELVNGILDISKIEANKMEIVEKDYNPNELFNDLAKLIKPRIGEKPIELSVNIAKDLPAILHGDEGKVKQITTNILTNAVKYTEKGSIKYNVSCVNMNNTSSLVISVEDTGRGIKEDQIDKLFNKFERLDEDRNTTLEGTGLGLAITKRLVEMMGGKIVVQSVYGSGSKFTIYLKQEITALTGELEKEEEKELANNDFSDSRVLVVDDNLLNLKVAKRLLKNYNIDSYDSDSGFDCISKIESKEVYDLILLDDMMPKMSGSETLEKLKKFNNFKTPVVVLTANAIEGMKDSYLAKGFDDYLAKPIEKTELERVLNKFLKPTKKENKEEKEEVKETKEEESTYNNRTYLEEKEIDVNHGLELLGDMETYNSIMNDFITEMEDRLPKLEEYKNNSDMENYAILVHAIKSDCKYLGIMKLADHNYEHELKSKANDVDFVLKDYNNLIEDINHYLEICKKYINK